MYCSRCGTNNREGSKFCNNCGAQLTPPVEGTCPACGTVNPLNTAFCNNCGARLVPAAATRSEPKPPAPPVKGLSLPTRSKPATPEQPGVYEDAARAEQAAKGPSETSKAQEPSPSVGADVPDWLAQLRAAPTEDEQTAPPVSEEIPDWIRQLQSIQLEEAASAPIPPVPSSGAPDQAEDSSGLPSWLVAAGDSSSWLPQQEPTAPAPRLIDEEPLPSEEKPSPLPAPAAEEPFGPFQQEVEQAATPPTAESTLPFPTEERTVPQVQADTQVSNADLPDWLQGLQPQAPAPSEAATAPTPPSQSGLPDWLVAGTSGELQPNLDGIPEWLRMAMPTERPAEAPLEESLDEPSVEPVFSPADTSAARQRVARSSPAATGTAEAEPVEAGNPLAGLRGILPLAIAVAEPHMLTEKPAPAATAEKDDGARLFEAILAEAPSEAEPTPAPAATRGNRTRWLIYLLLALAVIVPFFFPSGVAGSLLRISKTPAADVYDMIQALPPDATVIVSFDYEPSVEAEMDLLANAVVRHLIQRRLKIIALSTFDTGPQIAQKVLDSAVKSAKNSNYGYGSQYLNVGLIPGNEAGLANLAVIGLPDKDLKGQNVRQFPIAQNIKSMKDVALIIELAGTEEALQHWMEQVQPRLPTRIVGAVSAAVEPKALVYKRPGQLAGVFSGLIGAAQYEILSNQPGQALVSVNAQSAAQLVLVLIIVLGNVAYWISRAGGRVRTGARAEKAK